MHALLRTFVVGMAMARTAGGIRQAIRLAVARLLVMLLALAVLMVGLGFLIAGAYLFAETLLGPLYATLVIGGVLVLKAAVWFAVARRLVAAR